MLPSVRESISDGESVPASCPLTNTNTLKLSGRHMPSAPARPPTISTSRWTICRSNMWKGRHPASAKARSPGVLAQQPAYAQRFAISAIVSPFGTARGSARPGVVPVLKAADRASLPPALARDRADGQNRANMIRRAIFKWYHDRLRVPLPVPSTATGYRLPPTA